jgi:hypothetical protein
VGGVFNPGLSLKSRRDASSLKRDELIDLFF